MPSASVRTGAYARLGGGERDQRAEERRVLGDDHVAGVDHQLGGQVEPLLAALDDQHVVGGAGMPSRVSRSATWARSCGRPLEAVYCSARRVLGREQVARTPRAAPRSGTAPDRGSRRRRR